MRHMFIMSFIVAAGFLPYSSSNCSRMYTCDRFVTRASAEVSDTISDCDKVEGVVMICISIGPVSLTAASAAALIVFVVVGFLFPIFPISDLFSRLCGFPCSSFAGQLRVLLELVCSTSSKSMNVLLTRHPCGKA